MPKSLWLYLVAVVAFCGAFFALRTPDPAPISAPASVFSAGRALADVRQIARAAHPTGSVEIVRVRSYLLERLRQIGLPADLRTGQGVSSGGLDHSYVAAAAVQNIVGVLPGRNPAKPALLIMSHYDTVRNSPGAADDTAGVASSLEIARLLKAGPQPERDVIFLFTEAEEAGLLGAQAFYSSDPMAAHVGVVINLEARGDDGLAAMFETGPANAGLVALMARTGARFSATSMASAVYHKMPNGTDFTEALHKNLPGLNFAIADDQLAYHTPLATPDHLDPGALQHMGDSASAVARVLATSTDLPAAQGDAVYGDYLGLFLIHYPPVLGWSLIAASAVFAAFALIRAVMTQKLRLLELARGLCLVVMTLGGVCLAYELVGHVVGLSDYVSIYGALVHGEALLGAVLLGGLALSVAMAGAGSSAKGRITLAILCGLAAALSCLLQHGLDLVATVSAVVVVLLGLACLGKRVGVWGLWGGALLLAVMLGTALQALEPGVTPLLVWPLLLGASAALVVTFFGRGDPARSPGLLIVVVIAAPGLAMVLTWGGFVFTAIGASALATNTLILLSALPLAAPLFWTASRGPVGRVLAVLAGLGALICLGMTALGPNAARPGLTQAFYLSDPDARTWLVGTRLKIDSWSRTVMEMQGGKPANVTVAPLITTPFKAVAAKPMQTPGPMVSAERMSNRIILRAIPANGGETLIVQLRPSANLAHGRLNGREISLEAKAGQWTTLTYEAPPPEGIVLALDGPEHGTLETATTEVATGWPKGLGPIAPKPANRMGWRWSDATVAISRLTASW